MFVGIFSPLVGDLSNLSSPSLGSEDSETWAGEAALLLAGMEGRLLCLPRSQGWSFPPCSGRRESRCDSSLSSPSPGLFDLTCNNPTLVQASSVSFLCLPAGDNSISSCVLKQESSSQTRQKIHLSYQPYISQSIRDKNYLGNLNTDSNLRYSSICFPFLFTIRKVRAASLPR